MTGKMTKVTVRLPDWVLEYFEGKSKRTTIGKTTLMRSYLIEKVREKENLESGVEYGGNQNRKKE